MDKRPELGDFLRSRRARLRPEDVGLAYYGGRRRVPGLRREELAQLAGVSVAYYTRLEQGQSQNASDAVLDAVARALNLGEDERAYLRGLARPEPAARRRPRPERVRPGVRMMIESFGDVPAMVIGRCTDALAWNPMAHALLAGHLDLDAPDRPADRPNMARLLFLDPHTRELYADWRKKARDAVAYLRLAAGRYPDDPNLTALVGELAMKSPEFAALWSTHPVGDCAYNTREYRHPLVGALTLSEEVMPLPDDRGQRVMVWSAEPGSPSAAALRLLTEVSAETTDRPETAPARR
ncbi:helix-turn-helix transcriptional regulator [Actinoallomurus sp. NPDC052274]|uniref:helix-turn-helix transcriptional regulator n=1 Tax=Actinoallomurus sp. NPDC052274 TaxID=3155420 RepID=UPI00341DBC65